MGDDMDCAIDEKRERLLREIAGFRSVAVAFSAGVDSSVVAKAAYLALADRAVAVTGISPAMAAGELDQAREVARRIGIRHEVIETAEFANPLYVANAPDRCFHCKTELYTQLAPVADRFGVCVLLNGANCDDLGDYRPGMIAAAEHAVRSPLADCGFTKQDVRDLARLWELPVWDKPATPCLASRVAYGEQVTPERLGMIDAAERWLRGQGFSVCRVRYHRGDLARIELPGEQIARLCEPTLFRDAAAHLRSLGFKYITLDIEGFRSGSQNEVIAPESLLRP